MPDNPPLLWVDVAFTYLDSYCALMQMASTCAILTLIGGYKQSWKGLIARILKDSTIANSTSTSGCASRRSIRL